MKNLTDIAELYKMVNDCISKERLMAEDLNVILQDILDNEPKLKRKLKHLLLDYKENLTERHNEIAQTTLFEED